MAAAFQSNAFQNDAFQIDAAIAVVDAFNPTGIGAVVDFRKSDKAQAEFEAKRQANEADRKRAVYEAFYGKPPEPDFDDEFIAELVAEIEPETGPSEAIKQFAAMEAQRQQMQRMAQIRAKNDADTIELLLMVS